MTHDEALLKLLAVEPEEKRRLPNLTGWGERETNDVLSRLVSSGQVTFTPHINQRAGCRLYFARQAA